MLHFYTPWKRLKRFSDVFTGYRDETWAKIGKFICHARQNGPKILLNIGTVQLVKNFHADTVTLLTLVLHYF